MALRPFLNVPVSANPDSTPVHGGSCRDRKLAATREARLNASTSTGLTSEKETPMIHPAGGTDAGMLSRSKVGEQSVRDSPLTGVWPKGWRPDGPSGLSLPPSRTLRAVPPDR